MSVCPTCKDPFNDEHGHGLCFGCKIKGIRFGSVRQGPSVWALEKQAVEAARADGIEPERYEPVSATKKAERDRKAERELKRITNKMREALGSG